MKRLIIPALVLLALAGTVAAAHAIGIGQLGARFGGLGSIGKNKAVVAPSTCSGTGLIFNVACNSQYIGIL